MKVKLLMCFELMTVTLIFFSENVDTTHGQYVVTIQSDNVKYVSGTPMKMFGSVINYSGGEIIEKHTPVLISLSQIDSSVLGIYSVPAEHYQSTFVALAKNGTYSVTTIPPTEPSHYRVEASAPTNNFTQKSFSNSYVIEIQELFFTRPAAILYIGGITGFLGLLVVILKAPKTSTNAPIENPASDLNYRPQSLIEQISCAVKYPSLFFKRRYDTNTYTILRFIFLSILSVTPILAIVFTDVQISPNSPLGLIIKTGNQNNTIIDNQWVVNIGGIAINNYSTGIQIPVSVIIFGIAGSYLRFLYYTSTKESTKGLLEEPFYELLKDLALFLLAPLLAIAVWLLLYQGGTTSAFTLAVISFTIGLVTREVVQSLINFVSSKFTSQYPITPSIPSSTSMPSQGLSQDKTQAKVKIKNNENSLQDGQVKGSKFESNGKERTPKSN